MNKINVSVEILYSIKEEYVDIPKVNHALNDHSGGVRWNLNYCTQYIMC